ncbi:hypothetical protein FS749_000077 [Ceratobasidium sp. UAMH 11750]|nr:hypothetical protein FS749_000077 [Ceratobasidium sp. UAMH 11750]
MSDRRGGYRGSRGPPRDSDRDRERDRDDRSDSRDWRRDGRGGRSERRRSRSRSPRRDGRGGRSERDARDRREGDSRRDNRPRDRADDRRDYRRDDRDRSGRDDDRRPPRRDEGREQRDDRRDEPRSRKPETEDSVASTHNLDAPPNSSSAGPSKPPAAGGVDGEIEEGEDMEEDEAQMMTAMGFGGFDSTKGKAVLGNQQGAANIKKQRTWRQYMNRRGGFNRPLDKIK